MTELPTAVIKTPTLALLTKSVIAALFLSGYLANQFPGEGAVGQNTPGKLAC